MEEDVLALRVSGCTRGARSWPLVRGGEPANLPFQFRRNVLFIQPEWASGAILFNRKRFSRNTENLPVVVQGYQVRTVAQALDTELAKRIGHHGFLLCYFDRLGRQHLSRLRCTS